MDTKTRRGFNISLEFEYPNEISVEKFLSGSETALGKKDFSQPLKILNKHWVDNAGDLRLLIQEGQLRSIGLPIRLCGWIETELSRVSKCIDLPTTIPSEKVVLTVLEEPSRDATLPELVIFQWESDFDEKGILYWLGTRSTTQPWQNPADLGLVRISTSGLMDNSQPASALVGRELVRCVTQSTENAWFAVDFVDKYIRPTHYSLKHYDSWDTECLRDWKLEGSNDLLTWVLLREHKGDSSLRTKGGTATWTLTGYDRAVSNGFFRVFRCMMTGPNSNQHLCLACSGFEIYGELTGSAPHSSSSVRPSLSRALSPHPHGPTNSFDSKTKPPDEKELSGTEYQYQSDMDTNGIIYNIGTHGGQRPWINPGEIGALTVTASSVMHDSASVNYIVGREVVRCVTKPQPNSWFAIDLLDKAVLPSHYTLRHYSSWDTEALRNWHFEGSNDAVTWTMLMDHKNDSSLRAKGQAVTWPLPHVTRAKIPFRHFRIYQTGENSNGHHYLSLSGFELYGKIFELNGTTPYTFPPLSKQQTQTEFKHTSDFDGRGIIHYLATNFGQEQWRNPVNRGLLIVKASALSPDSQPTSAVVGQEVVRCVTKAEENSWFTIDLMGRAVMPSAYTLRHYSSWDTEALRSWLFQGSNDGTAWTTLREHKDDASLNTKGATHTWTLNCVHRFSIFRVLQTGPNSNSHFYLALSGFELYGTLFGAGAGKKRDRERTDSFSGINPGNLSLNPGIIAQAQSLGTKHSDLVWDPTSKGTHLEIYGKTAVNIGSSDKWQMCRSAKSFNGNRHFIALKIDHDPHTSNTWRFIVGAIPTTVDCASSTQWVGSKGSWGFISGTGGKCHNRAQSINYGARFGVGDVVGIGLDFVAGTVEFYKNGQSQGVAFTKVTGPVYVAASLTGTNSSISFTDWVEPSGPPSADGPIPVESDSAGVEESKDLASPPLTSTSSSTSSSSSSSAFSSPPPSPLPHVPLPTTGLGAWDTENKSKFLTVDNKLGLVTNQGSSDKWQSARSLQSWDSGVLEFQIEIMNSPETPNSWRMIAGVVPSTFTCMGNKQWVGAGGSWGYIAGTGGKCCNTPLSTNFGETWGGKGDVIGVRLDFATGHLEFLKNGVSQGVAYNNVRGPVHAAVSLTASGSAVRLKLKSSASSLSP